MTPTHAWSAQKRQASTHLHVSRACHVCPGPEGGSRSPRITARQQQPPRYQRRPRVHALSSITVLSTGAAPQVVVTCCSARCSPAACASRCCTVPRENRISFDFQRVFTWKSARGFDCTHACPPCSRRCTARLVPQQAVTPWIPVVQTPSRRGMRLIRAASALLAAMVRAIASARGQVPRLPPQGGTGRHSAVLWRAASSLSALRGAQWRAHVMLLCGIRSCRCCRLSCVAAGLRALCVDRVIGVARLYRALCGACRDQDGGVWGRGGCRPHQRDGCVRHLGRQVVPAGQPRHAARAPKLCVPPCTFAMPLRAQTGCAGA